MALAEIDRQGARILRPLGSPERARDVVEALLVDGGRTRGFRARVESEAADAAASAPGHPAERRDLTELDTFTVDPATARDFDDAVSAGPEGDGTRLWIHIADVAAHVRPGTALDAEAYARGNSTYVPGAVDPMLPAVLSSNACSLAPGVPRLAVTAEIVVSAAGEPASTRFYRSLIRSFHGCRPGKSGRCTRVSGYSCSESRFNKSSQSYDSRVTCTKGGKTVKHTYTQFT